MASVKLGLKEVVAMGIGGMVSGGIFAVLGVAMEQAGNAVPLSFFLAGVLTLITGYSYVKLTLYFREEGGAYTFLKYVTGKKHVAGLFSWILIMGYAGVMAMYAFAFGAYFAGLFGWEASIVRQVISVLIVVAMVGINLVGIKESGILQDILVYTKTAFLFIIAFVGIYFFQGGYPSVGQFFDKGFITPVMTFAIIFVAYEGFQLICYDYHCIKRVKKNLARAMYISIITAMIIYISVSYMATINLTPEVAIEFKEYALAKAVEPFIGTVGFALVVVVALQSTASGINATLFGTSRLVNRISKENELPSAFCKQNRKNLPYYSLLVMGILTATFTFFGSLEEITIFGSVVFLFADAVGNYSCLKLYKQTKSKAWIPAMGLAGCVVAIPIVFYYLWAHEPKAMIITVGIFITIVILYILYKKKFYSYCNPE